VTTPRRKSPGVIAEFGAINDQTPWSLRGSIGDRNGAPVILDLVLDRTALANAELAGSSFVDDVVTGELLKSIPMGRILQDVTAQVAADQRTRAERLHRPAKIKTGRPVIGTIADGTRRRDSLDRLAFEQFPTDTPRRGRRPTDDTELARLVGVLLDLQESDTRNVIKRLAKKEGGSAGPVPLETMRSRVKTAIARGLLTSRGSGAQGYLPGPRLANFQKKGKP